MRRGRRGGVGARGEGLGGISGWWRGIESGDGDVGCHETRNLQPIWSGGTGGKGDRDAKWNSARGNQDCRQESGMEEIRTAISNNYIIRFIRFVSQFYPDYGMNFTNYSHLILLISSQTL